MIPAAKPFVREVIGLFDHYQYPNSQGDLPTLGGCDFQTDVAKEQNRIQVGHHRFNKKLSTLPSALRSYIGGFTNISGWIDLHGIFSLAASLKMDETAANMSAKEKLREFGQPIAPLRSPKLQLLSYIFSRAFAQASEAEKENLITLATQLQPTVEATYSNFRRVSVKVSIFVSLIIQHPVTRGLIIFAAAYASLHVYFAAKSLFSTFLWQSAVPFIINPFINNASLTVIKVTSIIIGGVDWVIHNQIRIFICSCFADAILWGQAQRFADRIFKVLLIPLEFTLTIFFLPLGIFAKAASVTYQSHSIIADSLSGIADRAKASRLEAEGQKALRIWLDLSQMQPVQA